MVFVLLTYGGWNEASYVSAEVHHRRDIVRALVGSLVAITVLYVLVNWAYLRGLGLAGVAGSRAVAADLLERAVGPGGGRMVGALIAVCALTSANAAVFTGARTAYAFGRDFRVFAFLGRWHAGPRTPGNAIIAQGAVALALVLFGASTRHGFETMVEYTAPVFWMFFMLTGVSLVVLRRKEPDRGSPVPGPVLSTDTVAVLRHRRLSPLCQPRLRRVGVLVGLGVLAVGGGVLVLSKGREAEGGT